MELEGKEPALKAFNAALSPRYRRLDELERWVNGRQYDGLDSWWSDARPLWERAPCISYPIVGIAAQSNVDLVLGESRFPVFTSKPGEDTSASESGLGESDSEKLDRFLFEYHRTCRFRPFARDLFFAAQTCGSAVGIHGVRNGRPFSDLIPAKWCTPKFGIHGEVESLEIFYPYLEEYKQDGKWHVRAKLYRRVIDGSRDVTYLPADAPTDGVGDISWVEDKTKSVDHGLGFCPVIWYPFMRGCVPVSQIDGRAIHQDLTDEIRGLDIALSQRHRCALLSEPQPYEAGVEPGYNPGDAGRPAVMKTLEGSDGKPLPGSPGGGYGVFGSRGSSIARRKGPGYVWQYTDANVKVGYLTFGAEALKAQDDNARDLLKKIQEALCVVLLDDEHLRMASAAASGKALKQLKQRQIDRCELYRSDLEDLFLTPTISMQLRIAQRLGPALRVPGAKEMVGILKKFAKSFGGTPGDWTDPAVQVQWPEWSDPDPAEQLQIVQLVRQARGGGPGQEPLISKRAAVEKLADVFDTDNIDAALDAIEEETQQSADEEHTRQMQLHHALAKTLKDGNDPGTAGSGPGGAKNPPPGRSGGGADAALAKKDKGDTGR